MNTEQVQNRVNDQKKVTEEQLFEIWTTEKYKCECIGLYKEDNEHCVYTISDLRKPNFDVLGYYPGDDEEKTIEITLQDKIPQLTGDKYYIFTWKLSHTNPKNPYEICLDSTKPPKEIEAKWFIDKLFDGRYNDPSQNSQTIINSNDTLEKQLSATASTFIFELLQNANDYPRANNEVHVEFYVTKNYLLFRHTGDYFSVRNIAAICDINAKEKENNVKAIGYKGIGFKTVFRHHNYVYLRTGDYKFRFDEKYVKTLPRQRRPWKLLPIWTEDSTLDEEVNQVFEKNSEEFRVQIALRLNDKEKELLHTGKDNYEELLKTEFSDPKAILFIPNIKSVRVMLGDNPLLCRINSDEWEFFRKPYDIPQNIIEAVNSEIEKVSSKIPEKYKNISETYISFACNKEGKLIKQIPANKSKLYCYLPTKTQWGFPFYMNTDMIPKGDRSDIESDVDLANYQNFNQELSRIAGIALFDWLKELFSSKKYNLDSIFSLVPDFENECLKGREQYRTFINTFKNAFETRLVNKSLIPCSDNSLAKIGDVLYDTTGITASGIMTDEEFILFYGKKDKKLPDATLRKGKYYNQVITRYQQCIKKFETNDLQNMIQYSIPFAKWLQDQNNNNRFLSFLLDKKLLYRFKNQKIFLAEDGTLHSADKLYYDIDWVLKDLSAFEDWLPRLSSKTREYFKDNKPWQELIPSHPSFFADFNQDNFILNMMLSPLKKSITIERLKNKNISLHFYHFLAHYVKYNQEFLSLPFFNDSDKIVPDFKNKFIFFSSDEGHLVKAKRWMKPVPLEFLSQDYDESVKAYLRNNFEVQDFSPSIIIRKIIACVTSEERNKAELKGISVRKSYARAINIEAQFDWETHLDFINYCFEHQDDFPTPPANLRDASRDLREYSLSVIDKNGALLYRSPEKHIYFNGPDFQSTIAKDWINADWMFELDGRYFANEDDMKKKKLFFKQRFGVFNIQPKYFYRDIVRKHLQEIFINISLLMDSSGNSNFDFVKYLGANYSLIFDEFLDENKFKNIPLIDNSNTEIHLNSDVICFLYDDELEMLLKKSWFPKDQFVLLSPKYTESKALQRIGVLKYSFGTVFDIIIDKLISKSACSIRLLRNKEVNVDFHKTIMEYRSALTGKQLEKVKSIAVFLQDNNTSSEVSTGHNIITKFADELISIGLLSGRDFDFIDKEYPDNQNYWIALGNNDFSQAEFLKSLTPNSHILNNKEKNIKFWRWAKNNLDSSSWKKLSKLPVLIHSRNSSVSSFYILSQGKSTYISDCYLSENEKIENFVLTYQKEAQFLIPDYIQQNESKESWKEFWSTVGFKYDIADIIIQEVLPKLSQIRDDNLPVMLNNYRTALEKTPDFYSKLKFLQVKTADGKFRALKETLYISCQDAEPFPYIALPNQLRTNNPLLQSAVRDLDEVRVTKKSVWQQHKINQYIILQNQNIELIRNIHLQFITDLLSFNEKFSDIDKIKLLAKDKNFVQGESLTLSSVYHPLCDFEKYDITELKYLAECYPKENSHSLITLFHLHFMFIEKDIPLLAKKRPFAEYFWADYLKNNRSSVKNLIQKGSFNNIACIPTQAQNTSKKPSELYHPSLQKYLENNIEKWQEKIPFRNFPENIDLGENKKLVEMLPFIKDLSFFDAVNVLLTASGRDEKIQLLKWMLDDYSHTANAARLIEEYRKRNPLWKNVQADDLPLSDLYALDKNSDTLNQYFGKNDRIIDSSYLTNARGTFEKICDMLKIKIIKECNLKIKPENEIQQEQPKADLLLDALIIAGLEKYEGWQNRYEKYKKKIDSMNLYLCKAIVQEYPDCPAIKQDKRKFEHQPTSNDFYFVNSLKDNRVFKDFCKAFKDYLGIYNMDITLLEDILNSRENAEEEIRGRNELLNDPAFKKELDRLWPDNGLTGKGEKAQKTINVTPIRDYDDKNPEERKKEKRKNQEPTDTIINKPETITKVDPPIDNIEIEQPEIYKKPTPNGEPVRFPKKDEYTRRPGGKNTQFPQNTKYEPYQDQEEMPPTIRTVPKLNISDEEKEELERLLGGSLPKNEQILQHLVAELRLWAFLKEKNLKPEEDEKDFIRMNTWGPHRLKGGSEIYACSAGKGIMYLPCTIWKKLAKGNSAVFVCYGSKGNDYKVFHSVEDIITWVSNDNILLSLSGNTKAQLLKKFYGSIPDGYENGVRTLIRILDNANYDSLFGKVSRKMSNATQRIDDFEDDDYE